MRRGKCGVLLALAAALLVLPCAAFGDAITSYPGATSGSVSTMAEAWTQISGTIIGGADEYNEATGDNTYNCGRGILDAKEMAIFDAVLKNAAAPHHTEIHNAWNTNRALIFTALGGSAPGNASATLFCQQLITLLTAYATMGEWDTYYMSIANLRDYGLTKVIIPASAAGYDLSCGKYLGAYADLDGDGVTNGEEYAANPTGPWAVAAANAASTASAAWGNLPEAGWQNVIMDEKVKINGATPYLTRFFYNPDTDRLYIGLPVEDTYYGGNIDALNISINGTAMAAHLPTIRSQAEQDWFFNTVFPVYSYQVLNTDNNTMETKGDIVLGATNCATCVVAADSATAAPWVWDNGEPWSYTNWKDGEPSNGGSDKNEHWIFMKLGEQGKWNDDDVLRTGSMVFEFDGTFADDDSDGVPDMLAALFVTLPTAAFSATPVSGDMPLVVTFTDESVANGPDITAWEWNFGDGTTSTEQNPTHTYLASDPSSTYDVTLKVTNAMGSRTLVKNDYITVSYVCAFDGALTGQGTLLAIGLLQDDTIGAILTGYGFTSWDKWDIEGLGAVQTPGDGLPDALQMVLIERTACDPSMPHSAEVFQAMMTNKATFNADVDALEVVNPNNARYHTFADLFAGFFGVSPAMRATVLGMLGNPPLPHLAEYVYFQPTAKAVAPYFSGAGDLDGDGATNLAEYTEVAAAYAPITSENYDAFVNAFVIAATNPGPFWPGNPNLPVAGVVGLGLLAGSLLMGAGAALRRK